MCALFSSLVVLLFLFNSTNFYSTRRLLQIHWNSESLPQYITTVKRAWGVKLLVPRWMSFERAPSVCNAVRRQTNFIESMTLVRARSRFCVFPVYSKTPNTYNFLGKILRPSNRQRFGKGKNTVILCSIHLDSAAAVASRIKGNPRII